MIRIVLTAVIVSSLPAFARGAESFTFTVPLHMPAPEPVPALDPPPRSDLDVTRFLMGRRPDEWSPWALRFGDVVVFAWREFPNGALRADGFDVLRGVDVKTGRELWKRTSDRYADDAHLIDGDLLVRSGPELWLLDPRTGEQRWVSNVGHGGKLDLIGGALFVRGRTRLQRIHLATGAAIWSREVSAPEGLLVVGDALYLVEFRDLPQSDAGTFSRPTEALLLRFDVRTGVGEDRRPLHRYEQFHDVRRATLKPTLDGELEVRLGYIVLD